MDDASLGSVMSRLRKRRCIVVAQSNEERYKGKKLGFNNSVLDGSVVVNEIGSNEDEMVYEPMGIIRKKRSTRESNSHKPSLDLGLSDIVKRHKNRIIEDPISTVGQISQDVMRFVLQQSSQNTGTESVEIPKDLFENMEKILQECYVQLAKLDSAKRDVVNAAGKWDMMENGYLEFQSRVTGFLAETLSKRRDMWDFPWKMVVDSLSKMERTLGSINSIKGLVCCELNGLEIFEENFKKALGGLGLDASSVWSEKGVLVSEEKIGSLVCGFMKGFRARAAEIQMQDNETVVGFLVAVHNSMERIRVLNEILEPCVCTHKEAMVNIGELIEKPSFDVDDLLSLLDAYDHVKQEIQVPDKDQKASQ